MNRRQFTNSVAASLFAASPSGHLNIGVGTFSYHTLSLDDMVAQLTRLHVKEIEMSRGEFMLMHAPTAEMCQSARAKFDRAGIRCVSYYTATIKNDRDLDHAIRFAKILGAHNVSGDATGPILNRIDEQFTHHQLTFGIHNHWFKQGFPYQSAEDVQNALSHLSPTVGATLDRRSNGRLWPRPR